MFVLFYFISLAELSPWLLSKFDKYFKKSVPKKTTNFHEKKNKKINDVRYMIVKWHVEIDSLMK